MSSEGDSAERICLINMPFASPEAPSIALTQLQAVLEEKLGSRVSVEVIYLDLDFVVYTGGLGNYRRLTSGQGRLAGAADWFFRQVAFPEEPDNTEEYLSRFYFGEDEETRSTRELLLGCRPQAAGYLDELIEKYRLHEARVVGFWS